MPVPEDDQLVGIQIEGFGQFRWDWNRPGQKSENLSGLARNSKISPDKAYF
jgi:hypothetical protein